MASFTRVGSVARRQHGVISHAQLLGLGYTGSAIKHLVRTGRLWRVYRGIYALDGPLGAKGRAHAAVLRMGERSMAAFLSAAVLGDMWETWPSRPQILLAGGGGTTGPRGIDLHHSRTLLRSDVIHIDGIRTTSPRRTVLDCATILNLKGIKTLLRQAEFHHRLDLTTLDVPRAPKALQELLEVYVRGSGLTGNELEARFMELVASLAVTVPETQLHIDAYRVDFLWPDLGIIVETDGRDAHTRAIALTDDNRRVRRLQAQGHLVLRFTWNEIVHDATTVADDLLAALRSRAAGAPCRSTGG